MELFMALTGTSLTHVPFKGANETTMAIIANQMDGDDRCGIEYSASPADEKNSDARYNNCHALTDGAGCPNDAGGWCGGLRDV
jgi:hypothetical protein